MSYDLPHLRERFAIVTSRQDRGILPLIAGESGSDPAAEYVPSGALSYSHYNFSLPEFYDTILDAASVDERVSEAAQTWIEDLEERLGISIKEDIFEQLDTSWTGYSMFPEAGGAFPDSVLIGKAWDSRQLLRTLEKMAKDLGWQVEETTFRGKKIRFVSINVEPPGGLSFAALPLSLPGFSWSLAYFEHDNLLFFATNPLSLKRQILRFGKTGSSIQSDAAFQALAKKAGGEVDAFSYFDFGKMFTFFYNTLEPFLHFGRDFLRDTTGEYVIDLARLPLGETVGELIGPAYFVKRTEDDAILVESVANVRILSASSVFMMTAVGTAVAIPAFIMRRAGGGPPLVAVAPQQNEIIAQFMLQSVQMAQTVFRNSDMDRNGVADYWTHDLAGLYAMKDRNGNPIFLIDPATAAADMEGAGNYELLRSKIMPKNGYWFRVLTTDPDGDAYQKDPDEDGNPTTNRTRWAALAYPAAYGVTGTNTLLLGEDGITWKKDTQGRPVDRFPKDPARAGWSKAD